ncbi:MAG: insulinase family protein [Pilosibacter sp.]
MESQIESVKALDAYRLRQVKHIPELNSDGMILEHKKTGANIFLMSNEDNNKVFCIGFRTPPSDSTGVPHIIEHTVLCGSDKFPVKDPFVELVKGSLNTFLNAMTYPDKTVYPIASCNDTDFQNLMDVYMDAVFHPNIGKEKKIFMQEGWHYELEDPEGEITYNGVVYNEMKGCFPLRRAFWTAYPHGNVPGYLLRRGVRRRSGRHCKADLRGLPRVLS